VGHRANDMRPLLSDLELTIVCNPDYASGQSTSVKAGLKSVHPSASGVLFIPVDQPFLSSEVLDQLINTYQESEGLITLPACKGRRGSPVLFDRSLFPELAAITGDRGGRQILKDHEKEIVTVTLENEKPLMDIDTPETYRELIGHHSE
jgi:molybdenum cofactor cytidylyltransferase